ncbi:hypothetical protein [Krasilnikovia sp. M28-CT-15]|uniref:hypothetical protein n=1 Tax=Krasilnikovia sp. M28-CT-15 TaxID=3373540 RepID=UPI00399C7BF5
MDCAVIGIPPGATPVEDAFIDLVCADDDLVRGEFDALIAASWPTPPAVPPVPPRPVPWPSGLVRLLGEAARRLMGHVPDTERRRQRAPP